MDEVQGIKIGIPDHSSVSGLWAKAQEPWASITLAHGAGAGMHHDFMNMVSQKLTSIGIHCLRFQFPYMEAGKRRVDSQDLAKKTIAAAFNKNIELSGAKIPQFLAGKSFGGRMASHAVADGLIEPRGLIFLGFPLHPAGKPGTERAHHLGAIATPMLFIQGDRDTLARFDLIQDTIAPLASAHLTVIDDGDHSFKVRKKSGNTPENVAAAIQATTRNFCEKHK